MYTGGSASSGEVCLGDLPWEGSASRGSPSGGFCLGESASGGLPRGSASWGSTSRVVCIQGGLHPGGLPGVYLGRFASRGSA